MSSPARKTKHGPSDVPFERRKRQHGGYDFVFTCASIDCRNIERIGAGKHLPPSVVCQKVEREGWKGRGHSQPGVPAVYYCPECSNRSKTEAREEQTMPSTNDQPRPQETGHQQVQYERTQAAMRVLSTNEGKNRSLSIRVSDSVLDKLGSPSRCVVQQHAGYLVLNFNPVAGEGVKISRELSGGKARVQIGASKLPFQLPDPGQSIEPEFIVNTDNRRLISSGKVVDITDELSRAAEPGRLERARRQTRELEQERRVERTADSSTASTEPPKPPTVGGISVDDGASLKQMLNDWLDECERNGFSAELEVDENRLKRIRVTKDI